MIEQHTGAPGRDTNAREADRESAWARFLYGGVAPIYNAIRPLWSSRPAESRLDALFTERIGPATRVLELAPGTGVNIRRLRRCAPDFGSYLGIDISSAMLRRAQAASRNDPRVTLRIGDATDLSGVEGAFGFIVCTWLLSHLDRPEEVVRATISRLGSGGTAAFLFFTRPDHALLGRTVGLFVHSYRGKFVDLAAISSLPHLESLHRYGGGYAALAVFRSGS